MSSLPKYSDVVEGIQIVGKGESKAQEMQKLRQEVYHKGETQ